MPHLLHVDSSIQGERSVSRRLTARAAAQWRAAHADGTVTYRDLAADPVPHFDGSYSLSAGLIDEVRRADTILLGLPVYNFGAPSAVKAWVDHLVAPGLSVDPETHAGLLGGRELIVLAARGSGYGAGTPREGWDHAEAWLPHGISYTGLEPKVWITAELTLAETNPAMADLRPLAAESLAAAERQIDALWALELAGV
jgi:FMN-dependent NADH-azoreductase